MAVMCTMRMLPLHLSFLITRPALSFARGVLCVMRFAICAVRDALYSALVNRVAHCMCERW